MRYISILILAKIAMQLDNIDAAKSAIVSLSSVIVSAIVPFLNVVPQDPAWFCIARPFLQTGAWVIAIVAGVITIRNKKRKSKPIKDEKQD